MLSPMNLGVSPVPGCWGEKFSLLLLKASTLLTGCGVLGGLQYLMAPPIPAATWHWWLLKTL